MSLLCLPRVGAVPGPRGMYLLPTRHAVLRWLERTQEGVRGLAHALRHSRLACRQGVDYAGLWYEPDGVLFVCREVDRERHLWAVLTVLPAWLDGGSGRWAAVGEYRRRAGLCQAKGGR